MTEGFYVSVLDGPRKGLLLGPYDSHDEALRNVERGKRLAFDKLPKGVFGAQPL